MEWLLELARPHGMNSVRQVSLQMEASDEWPADGGRTVESVANKLRQLNRGEDPGWWTGKGEAYLPALADVLDMDTVDELLESIDYACQPEPVGDGRWRFGMFPTLRPIDVGTEQLFPGIPKQITRVGGPTGHRVWWIAPPGAGKTIVGRRLERYGWTVLSVASWSDLGEELPARGRVFIELGSRGGLSHDAVSRLPAEIRVCVAASFGPPTPRKRPRSRRRSMRRRLRTAAVLEDLFDEGLVATRAGWVVVESEAQSSWAHDVIEWVASRVRPRGGFDAAGVHRLLEGPQFEGLFTTPGELIDFLGMVEVVGLDDLEDGSPMRQVRAWLCATAARRDRRVPEAMSSLLEKRGAKILVGMTTERIREGKRAALSVARWTQLVPDDDAPPLDRQRLGELLEEGTTQAIERARAMIKPGGSDIVEGLCGLRALGTAGNGKLAVSPTWVRRLVEESAIEQLLGEGPQGLGALLLHPETVGQTLEFLLEEVRGGRVERVVAAFEADPDSPEQVVALDGAFRTVGLAVALGAEVPTAVVGRAWEAQMEHARQPYPNLPVMPLLSLTSDNNWEGVTSLGGWFAAALAISRRLVHEKLLREPSALVPWFGLPEDHPQRRLLEEAVSRVAMAFCIHMNEAQPGPLQLAAYRLGGDLLDQVGMLKRSGGRRLQLADLLVVLSTGEAAADDHDDVLGLPFGLVALEDACDRRDVQLDDVLAWCWRSWGADRGACPPLSWTRDEGPHSDDDVVRLWQAAPALALSEEFIQEVSRWRDVWPFLGESAWSRWIEVSLSGEMRQLDHPAAFEEMPERYALQLVRDGFLRVGSVSIVDVLWKRMPEHLVELVAELSRSERAPEVAEAAGRDVLCELLYRLPRKLCAQVLEMAERWIDQPADYPGVGSWLPGWLMWIVETRRPRWRDAYAVLRRSAPD